MDALAIDYLHVGQLTGLFFDDDRREGATDQKESENRNNEKFEAHGVDELADNRVVVAPILSRQYFLHTAIKFVTLKKNGDREKSLSAPNAPQTKQSKPTQRKTYALDYLCNSADSLAARLHGL